MEAGGKAMVDNSTPKLTLMVRFLSLFSVFAVSTACQSSPIGSLPFSCSVEGSAIAGSPDAICAAFQKSFQKAVKTSTHLVSDVAANSRSDRIDVQVRVMKRGSIFARVIEVRAGKIQNHPEIAIDVMDRRLAFRDIETLADESAKLVQR